MTQAEKEAVRKSRRFNQPLEEGTICYIDADVLDETELYLFRDFLDKPASIIKTIGWWEMSTSGLTYLNKLKFEHLDFSVNKYLDYQPNVERVGFDSFEGFVDREVLIIKE